jgi:hypothetical protein
MASCSHLVAARGKFPPGKFHYALLSSCLSSGFLDFDEIS